MGLRQFASKEEDSKPGLSIRNRLPQAKRQGSNQKNKYYFFFNSFIISKLS